MTPEQRAQISRENGAKSRGPVTAEGKARSSRNSMVHGNNAAKLRLFQPPHSTCLCNEDRQAFYQLFDDALALYKPNNRIAADIVREIVCAQWQVGRNSFAKSAILSRRYLQQSDEPSTAHDELVSLDQFITTIETAYSGNEAAVLRLERETDRLHLRISRLERRLQTLSKQFPVEADVVATTAVEREIFLSERTWDEPGDLVENTENASENGEKSEELHAYFYPARYRPAA